MDKLIYEMFLVENAIEQAELEKYINECIMISNNTNTISNIETLNENFSDKVKESFAKILSSIGAIWKKFLETTNNLIKNDEAYLNKYKDIILKKKPVDATYNMYDYNNKSKGGVSLLYNTPLPSLNVDNIQPVSDKDEYIKNTREFSIFTQGYKPPYDLNELAKIKYRGGSQQVQIKSSELNMTDIYNYCKDYSKIKDLLNKDITTIKATADKAIKLINDMSKDTQNNTSGSTNESFNIENLLSKPKYYSSVYESYITEEENPNNNSNNNQNKLGNGARIEDEKVKQEKQKNDELEKKKEALRNVVGYYLSACGNVLGAKQTIAQEIYKAYMSIIKAHVRDYAKSNGKLENKPEDGSTQNKGYNSYTNSNDSASAMMGLNN